MPRLFPGGFGTAARRLRAMPDDGCIYLLRLLNFNLYGLGALALGLRDMDCQNAILTLSANAMRIGVVG